jgi:predicted RNA binding protein YcfA (HicA-like mRNA interferase family)
VYYFLARIIMKGKDVLKILREDGWYELPGRGTSHKHLKHPSKPGKVTVPVHPGDIPLGTLKRIERQAGIRLT